VKHLSDDAIPFFADLLATSGLDVPVSEQSMLLGFLDELIEENQKINLTRITEPSAAIRLHLVDSLLALPEVHESPSGVILDLGSGGGLPGVPLAVVTGRHTVLLDSVRKKGQAVLGVLLRTNLAGEIEISGDRAEAHALTHLGQYSCVVARAVAPLPTLLELASPLLANGGTLVALKGDPGEDEMASGRVVARQVGFGPLKIRRVELPGGQELRTIVSATKAGRSLVRLPRRIGLAKSSPLG